MLRQRAPIRAKVPGEIGREGPLKPTAAPETGGAVGPARARSSVSLELARGSYVSAEAPEFLRVGAPMMFRDRISGERRR